MTRSGENGLSTNNSWSALQTPRRPGGSLQTQAELPLVGGATPADALKMVYATTRELVMSESNWVDTSKQISWQFDLDEQQPSSYLVRLHFCDIVGKAPHLLRIDVYVDSYTTMLGFDLSNAGNGALAFPYYSDFILDSKDLAGRLTVSVGSSSTMKMNTSGSPGPILNGVEIMRIHLIVGSIIVVKPIAGEKKKNLAVVLGSVGGAFALVSIAAAVVTVFRKKEEKETPMPMTSQPSTPWMPLLSRISFRSAVPSPVESGSARFTVDTNTPGGASPSMALASVVLSYRFPFAVLLDATRNFDDGLVVGVGGFRKVYAAVLQDGTKVAVKRASSGSRQGAREFRTEIDLLSGLRHRHLVSLIGYCDE
ncbi:hypothetical protein GUJ93_ZPchr0005g15380 [Zizania palustris]|uniref:Protein kinase domain-containing protein n=1 Tax=Zizania palustris TaxID=103762 RepID=A0A8J5SCB2_ZIZPA|nr:hypothetical protein GUJ93_ZPchr0005g15380 [Zizania palustris]